MSSASHEEAPRQGPVRGSAVQALGVFLIFAIVGPLLGGFMALIFLLLFGHRPVISEVTFGEIGFLVTGIMRVVVASFFVVGLQAAGMGLVAAGSQIMVGKPRVPFIPVLLASLLLGAAATFIVMNPLSPPRPDPAIVTAALAIHLGMGLLCWLIANVMLQAFEPRRAEMAVP
jgi:hypothetical protein